VDGERAITRWAKIGVVVLEVLGIVSFAVVLFFMDGIVSSLTDSVGTWAVIVGALFGSAILIGVAYLLFDRPSRRRR
jgi:uncharacterized membrane protein